MKRSMIDWVLLPIPDNSLYFFEVIKNESEKHWSATLPNDSLKGCQIKHKSIWKPGLNEEELERFQRQLEITFPFPLANFYRTMNGLTSPEMESNSRSARIKDIRSCFYSFPDDVNLMKEKMNRIYKDKLINKDELQSLGIPRLIPVYENQFMVADLPEGPIISLFDNEIRYTAENLSKLLVNQIFENVYNVYDFESPPQKRVIVKFWID